MRTSPLAVAALSLLCLSSPVRASGDPLLEADRAAKRSLIPAAASLKNAPRPTSPAPRSAAAPDYCVVAQLGSKGPDFLKFACTGAVSIPVMRRMCWTSGCRAEYRAEIKAMMLSKGYASAGAFDFARPNADSPYHAFVKSGVPGGEGGLCLALRFYHKGATAFYRIDCADGAVTELSVAEPDGGHSRAARYMKENRGRELAAVLPAFENESFSALLFRKSPRP